MPPGHRPRCTVRDGSAAARYASRRRAFSRTIALRSVRHAPALCHLDMNRLDLVRREADSILLRLAAGLLGRLGSFSRAEIDVIAHAIARHSDKAAVDGPLDGLLKDADVAHHWLYDPALPALRYRTPSVARDCVRRSHSDPNGVSPQSALRPQRTEGFLRSSS